MSDTAIYWFRNDLRLHDNLGLTQAASHSTSLLPVYCHDAAQGAVNHQGIVRCGALRQHFIASCLDDLRQQLQQLDSNLLELYGDSVEQIASLAKQVQANKIYCEQIQAPEEINQIKALEEMGFEVVTVWQSSLLPLERLPFDLMDLPDVFTQFRVEVEKNRVLPAAPLARPSKLPPLPKNYTIPSPQPLSQPTQAHPHSAFAFQTWSRAGETQALAQLHRYFSSAYPKVYKQTRNQLTGWNYSTKFSVWLACGAISARKIYQALKQYEQQFGASDGSYWIWFELLWRDYFRCLHFKYGRRLYLPTGLQGKPLKVKHIEHFALWRDAKTGNRLIDAAMNELRHTGFLSNRLRQIVASYLIYDLGSDWRLGAAWFESQLLDYDVYSNHGNWLYIAGYGTDPRGGRRFDVDKQMREHDPQRQYQTLWKP